MSFDRLHQLIRKTKNPTVAGLDARLEYIPPQLVKECMDKHGENLEGPRRRCSDITWLYWTPSRGSSPR